MDCQQPVSEKGCTQCGAAVPSQAVFCPQCGAQFGAAPTSFDPAPNTYAVQSGEGAPPAEGYAYGGQPYQQNPYQAQPGYMPGSAPGGYPQGYDPNFDPNSPMTERQFYDRFASKGTKSQSTALAIICFITCAISLINLLAYDNVFGLIDLAFYLPMGILLLTVKKWFIPLITICYSGFWTLFSLFNSGLPAGILALILGILAAIAMKKVNKAYKHYQSTGQFPAAPI